MCSPPRCALGACQHAAMLCGRGEEHPGEPGCQQWRWTPCSRAAGALGAKQTSPLGDCVCPVQRMQQCRDRRV